MKRAVIITPAAETLPLPIDTQADELDILQKAVGGYIEVWRGHYFEPNLTVFVDEEGSLKNLPVNVLATALFDKGGLGSPPVLGNAVVIGRTTDDGEITGLTIKQVNVFLTDTDDLLNELIKAVSERDDSWTTYAP